MNYYNWIIPIVVAILVGGYYINKKILNIFKIENKTKRNIYWVISYIIITVTIVLRNVFSAILASAFWMFVIFDILFIIFKKSNLKKALEVTEKIYYRGITVVIISVISVAYGVFVAYHPITNSYEVKVNKVVQDDITISLIADLHLGSIEGEKFLEDMVKASNKTNADIVVLVGDIFDEHTTKNEEELAYDKFKELKSKHGVYYVEGNHDLLTDKMRRSFKEHNVEVLEDKVKFIDDKYYLIGRKDYRRVQLKEGRKSLNELLKTTNDKYPIIVLDHQPQDEKLGQELKVDLQLSGHTHAGQMFPANFVLKHGIRRTGDYSMIVSNGYGTWNFPVRTAERSELVKIIIPKNSK